MFSMTEWPFCVKIWKRMYTGEFTKDNSLFSNFNNKKPITLWLIVKDYMIILKILQMMKDMITTGCLLD